VASIKVRGALIPICFRCKKICGEKGYWEHTEKYVQTRTEAQFSPAICPDCAADLYPDIRLGQVDRYITGGNPAGVHGIPKQAA
jgi:hypothetical protein